MGGGGGLEVRSLGSVVCVGVRGLGSVVWGVRR